MAHAKILECDYHRRTHVVIIVVVLLWLFYRFVDTMRPCQTHRWLHLRRYRRRRMRTSLFSIRFHRTCTRQDDCQSRNWQCCNWPLSWIFTVKALTHQLSLGIILATVFSLTCPYRQIQLLSPYNCSTVVVTAWDFLSFSHTHLQLLALTTDCNSCETVVTCTSFLSVGNVREKSLELSRLRNFQWETLYSITLRHNGML